MAILPETSRYTDLLSYLPTGSFYESLGTVIPYRFGNTEIRLETANPNTKFGLYLNDKYSGTVVSDVEGNVVFNAHFDRGDAEVKLINLSTGRKFTSWVTVREYALWLAAYAEVLSDIDDSLSRVYDSLFVNQVQVLDAEDRFGEEIETYNNIGLSIDSYRKQLHELRLAYRNWGTSYRGLDHAVADFTQVPPFGYQRRKWGPNWVIDQSMLKNHRFLDRSHDLSWGGAGIDGVSLIAAEPDVVQSAGAHILVFLPSVPDDLLSWMPNGVPGPFTPIHGGGEIFLPGPESAIPAFVLGNIGAFGITAGVNDYLYLNIDERGTIAIQLVTGLPFPTVGNVAADINAALLADVRYGILYGTVASLYNSKILLESVGDSLLIEDGVQNAAVTLFGAPREALTFDPNPIVGFYSRAIDPLLTDLGTAGLLVDTTVTPATVIWAGPGAGAGAPTPIATTGTYTVTDAAGNTLHFYVDLDELPVSAITVTSFTVGYCYEVRRLDQNQGLHIIVDTTLLPGVLTFDTVTVMDDATGGTPETPDNWFITLPSPPIGVTTDFMPSDVVTSKLEALDPTSAFSWHVQALGNNVLALDSSVNMTPMPRPGPRGSAYPQRSPGLFYDYEGFTATFSGWVRSREPAVTTVRLGFSWDGGVTWTMSVPQVVVSDVGGSQYEDKTFVSFSTVIPAEITDNSVVTRLYFTSATPNVDVDVDSFRVQVEDISSAFLTNATVPRTRHRQYFGELIWVWSPEELTLTELEYIGIQHKKPNRYNPFSGVELLTVSSDTPVGVGTMTYRYNSVGDVRELKWDAAGTTWGPGLGWVVLLADGAVTLTASDGSAVSVYVTYSMTPTPLGTPPAIEATSDITISDITVNPGHARKISPVQSSIDIFDVTEYDSIGQPVNLTGAITEGDFAACTLTNLDIQPSDPFRYSYAYPSDPPVSGETLTVDSVTFLAPLAFDSDQDQDNSVLYIDGLPLFNIDPATGLWAWRFTAANQVEIRPAYYSSLSVYTIDYNLLYQVTTPMYMLTALYKDYAWWADYYLWDRHNSVQGEYPTEVPIVFNASNGRGYLLQESTMDQSTSHLYVQNAYEQREVPQRNWRFLNATTLELDLTYLVSDSQYLLSHTERRVYETSSLVPVFEHRSGITPAACLAAAWGATERNANVSVDGNERYHQMRLSVSGIRDVRDFKIRSIVLKGLHLYGAGASVPGLV